MCGRAGRLTAENGGLPARAVHNTPVRLAALDAAGLDEGLPSLCRPILVCMENPYKKTNGRDEWQTALVCIQAARAPTYLMYKRMGERARGSA